MASGRLRRRNDPSVMSSIEFAVREVRRPSPLEACWNWRWELGILAIAAGLSAIIAAGIGVIGLAVAAGTGLAALGALLRHPPARKRLAARAWCVITPHRIRVGCVNAWVQTRSGRLPVVLSTTPAEYGEQVLLWCRAGITAADLFAARDGLAAACWAAQVRVIPSLRHSHLVTLEVIRHRHPEPALLTLRGWPLSRDVADGTPDDSGEPDTVGAWGEPAVRPD